MVQVVVNNFTGTTPVVTITQPTCTVSTGSISVTSPTGLTYTSNGGPSQVSTTFSPLASGTYLIRAIDANGCPSSPATAIINSAPITPTAPTITPTKDTICSGSMVTLNASGCGGTVTWYLATDVTFSSPLGTSSSLSVSPTATTSYVVTPPLVPTISATSTMLCNGQSSTLTVNNCTGTIEWFLNGSATSFSSANPLIVSPTSSSIYTAACNTSAAGVCGKPSASITITVNPIPATPTITPSTSTICQGSSATLTASGAGAGESYLWSNGATGTSISVSPSMTTSYTVKIVNTTTTCEGSLSTAQTITVTPLPTGTPTVTTGAICVGQSATLAATGCSSGSTAWYFDAALTTPVTGPVSPTVSTTYYVRCENGVCYGPSLAYVLVVNSKPAASISGPDSVCTSGSATTFTANGGVASYAWSITGTGTISGATNTQNVSVIPSGVGNYILSLTTTNANGCDSTITKTVKVNMTPVNPTVSTTAQNCTAATTTSITNYSSLNIYTFSPAGPTVDMAGLISGATAGTAYTVTATRNMCSSMPTSFLVQVQINLTLGAMD
jgi:hypothetical protein